jgi:PPOX class probable F420-dependent enzyme
MTPEERNAFLSEARTAVLATVDAKGRTHAVPVWYLWRDGAFRIITDRGSQKHRNAVRAGRASLTIVDGYRYASAEGSVSVQDPISLDDRLALHVAYRGEDGARKAVADGRHAQMVILVLKPERWFG